MNERNTRKVKPYPAIVTDALEPVGEEFQALVECMAGVVAFALFVIFVLLAGAAGATVYAWGLLL